MEYTEMNGTVARVVNIQKNRCQVVIDEAEYSAVLTGKLLYRAEYPVVGDYVTVDRSAGDADAHITAILPRKSYITRPDRGGHGDNFVKTMGEQAMAANVDLCFLVTSMNEDYSVNRIARYAAAVLHGGAKPIVVLTKADLCPDAAVYIDRVHAVCGTIPVHGVSAVTGAGIDALEQYLTPGTTICFFGSSGVGKSTLVNRLLGCAIMRTGEIRASDGKGRHTTTHRQLIEGGNGVFLIDTPGMREFGVCGVDDGLRETFSDITALAVPSRTCTGAVCRKWTWRRGGGGRSSCRFSLSDDAVAESRYAAHAHPAVCTRRWSGSCGTGATVCCHVRACCGKNVCLRHMCAFDYVFYP